MKHLRDARRLDSAGLCALVVFALTASAATFALAAESPAPSAYAMQVADSLPAYEPKDQVSGTIRLWGHGSPKHDFMGKLVRRWSRDFHRYQPHVTIVNDMYGTASAVGALYTGAGDLAILGEELSPAAERAFRRERHYAPTAIEIATGNVAANYYDYAHMVFVNRANPLDRLTVPQLARILGDPPAGAASGPIRTWGQLGLRGAWANRKIQPYSWTFDQDFGLFLWARVLGGGPWNPQIRRFVTYDRPDGTIVDRGAQILAALARDPDGIAVSNSRFANPAVKLIKLAATSSGPYLLPSEQTLISQQYPLTRIIPAVVDIPPGQPLDPAIREFLRFILSRQGQHAVIEESGYLPLGPQYVRAQLRKLDELSLCRAAMGCRSGRQGGSLTALQIQELASGPGHPLNRVVRVWGNAHYQPLGEHWAERFRVSHARDRVAFHMTGSDTGMAALYTGEADIALLGRPATASELQAFEWVFRRPPACLRIPLRGFEASTSADNGFVYVYRNSGEGSQPLAPDFIHSILGQSRQAAQSCASAPDSGLAAQPQSRGTGRQVHGAFAVQRARNAFLAAQSTRKYYSPGQFDLRDLPDYVPAVQITGTVRVWTSDMWGNPGFRERLAEAFHRLQPRARLQFVGISPGGAFAGLLTGLADVAIGRRMTWVELLSYQRKFNRDPLVIRGMTGWFVNPPFVIAVNKDNPIASLSLAQLDGIFGAERNGGWQGMSWDPTAQRGRENNIRFWGEAGLQGNWVRQPIAVYGYNLAYLFAPRFSDDVLGGSGKWNEQLQQFTIAASRAGKLLSVDQQMANAVGGNRDAIAYYSSLRGHNPDVRFVPIRLSDGRIVTANIDAVRDHSYPLYDNMWIYASRGTDGSVPANVREFLSFILSRQAQEEVNLDTTMLPLTHSLLAEERKKLR